MSAIGPHAFLLSSGWLGNVPEQSPLAAYNRTAGTREDGDVIPGTWVAVDIGPRAWVVPGWSRPGDNPLQKEPTGERVADTIEARVPLGVQLRTIDDVGQADASVVQFMGESYRVTRFFFDPESGMNSLTGRRIQPRNLPPDLPVAP